MLFEPFERGRDIGARLGRDTLTILGEVGEHREQHETADEGERIVEAERIEPRIDVMRIDNTSCAIDRGRADIFDPSKQLFSAICLDHIAKQAAKKADVGILRDRHGFNLAIVAIAGFCVIGGALDIGLCCAAA